MTRSKALREQLLPLDRDERLDAVVFLVFEDLLDAHQIYEAGHQRHHAHDEADQSERPALRHRPATCPLTTTVKMQEKMQMITVTSRKMRTWPCVTAAYLCVLLDRHEEETDPVALLEFGLAGGRVGHGRVVSLAGAHGIIITAAATGGREL